MHRATHKQTGFSLIEVLITVVLVSIGLLGLAGLQLMTVQNTNSAAERFEATTLARNILERMRANRQQARNGLYNLALGAAPSAGGLVGDDQVAWVNSLGILPAGQGAIAVNPAGIVTIEVQWIDASDDNAGDARDMSIFLRSEL